MHRHRRISFLSFTAVLGLTAAAPIAHAAGPVMPHIKSATVPSVLGEGPINGVNEQARVVVATSRLAPTRRASIVVTLMKGTTRLGVVGRKTVKASKPFRSRLVRVDLDIPLETPRDKYRLKICIGASCKSVPFTRMGLPRGYEGSVTAEYARTGIDISSRQTFNGSMRFERVAPFIPGQARYALVGGQGTVNLTATDTNCTTTGATPVSFPANAFKPELAVTDARIGTYSDGQGNRLKPDPGQPYYYFVNVQARVGRLGPATRSCTDGTSETVDVPPMSFLIAGSSLVVWPDGGFENVTRRLANAEELLGTRTASDSIGGTSTWNWTLTSFD